MYIFELNQKIWTLCGIMKTENAGQTEHVQYFLVNFYLNLNLAVMILFSYMYLHMNYDHIGPAAIVYVSLQIVSGVSVFLPYVAIAFNHRKLLELTKMLQQLVNDRDLVRGQIDISKWYDMYMLWYVLIVN